MSQSRFQLSDFRPGEFFSNDAFIREVISVVGDQVEYRYYGCSDGEPCGGRKCSIRYLRTWALRKATPEERDRIAPSRGKPTRLELEGIAASLQAATDKMLLAEIARRRGFVREADAEPWEPLLRALEGCLKAKAYGRRRY